MTKNNCFRRKTIVSDEKQNDLGYGVFNLNENRGRLDLGFSLKVKWAFPAGVVREINPAILQGFTV